MHQIKGDHQKKSERAYTKVMIIFSGAQCCNPNHRKRLLFVCVWYLNVGRLSVSNMCMMCVVCERMQMKLTRASYTIITRVINVKSVLVLWHSCHGYEMRILNQSHTSFKFTFSPLNISFCFLIFSQSFGSYKKRFVLRKK